MISMEDKQQTNKSREYVLTRIDHCLSLSLNTLNSKDFFFFFFY